MNGNVTPVNGTTRNTPPIMMNVCIATIVVRPVANNFSKSRCARNAVRLGVPNYPGDTLQISGTVNAIHSNKPAVMAEVTLTAVNGLGQHASATVVVELPPR